eukprot:990470-Rhodomonas_salina.6
MITHCPISARHRHAWSGAADLAEREAGDLSLELVVQQSRPPSEKLDEGFFVGEDTRLCDVACIHAQRGCTSGVAARHALERRLQVPKALRQQHSTAARGCSSSVAARHALQRRLQVPKALRQHHSTAALQHGTSTRTCWLVEELDTLRTLAASASLWAGLTFPSRDIEARRPDSELLCRRGDRVCN